MGKLISVLGDSISTFEGVTVAGNRTYYDAADTNGTGVTRPADTWWAQVIERAGGTLLANAAFSGGMVAGAGFPAARTPERARQILGAAGETPDEVLVFIGINDYGWGSADAQARGGSEAAPGGSSAQEAGFEPGLAPAGALQEFARAYDEMLEGIRAVAPEAAVRCMTLLPGRVAGSAQPTFCPQLRGISVADYNRAIKCAAAANGCDVADVAAFGLDYEASDGTHPTARGMRQLAELSWAAMTGGQPDGSLFAGMASGTACERASGVGCHFAQSTGAKWSCVCHRTA